MSNTPTQTQMFYAAHRHLSDFQQMLSDNQQSDNPFTADELQASADKGLPVPPAMISAARKREAPNARKVERS